MLIPSTIAVQNSVIDEIQKHFDHRLVKASERIKVIPDTEYFNPNEDINSWKQKRGYIARHYSVYFDNEFVCGFDEDVDIIESVMLRFWRGLKPLLKDKKVYLNKYQYQIEEELEKQRSKAAEEALISADTSTPEKKLAKEVVKRLIRRKKRAKRN